VPHEHKAVLVVTTGAGVGASAGALLAPPLQVANVEEKSMKTIICSKRARMN